MNTPWLRVKGGLADFAQTSILSLTLLITQIRHLENRDNVISAQGGITEVTNIHKSPQHGVSKVTVKH